MDKINSLDRDASLMASAFFIFSLSVSLITLSSSRVKDRSLRTDLTEPFPVWLVNRVVGVWRPIVAS
jgi:hypothetical protein